MNYITRLKAENEAHEATRAEVEQMITDFMVHLQLPKFVGADDDGDRKDWISVGDVMDRLSDIRSAVRL